MLYFPSWWTFELPSMPLNYFVADPKAFTGTLLVHVMDLQTFMIYERSHEMAWQISISEFLPCSKGPLDCDEFCYQHRGGRLDG